MICPKCGSTMTPDDFDEDYGKIKNKTFVIRRKKWWVCIKCNCGVIKEEKYEYFDEDGSEFEVEDE